MSTHSELVREVDDLRSQAQALLERTGSGDLVGRDAERFDELTAGIEQRKQQIERLERAHELALSQIRSGGEGLASEGGSVGMHRIGEEPGTVHHSSYDADRPPANRERDAALRTVERSQKEGLLTAGGAEVVEHLVGSGPAPARSWAARWVTETGSAHYRNAFAKMVTDPQRGHLQWTAQEGDAWRRVTALQAEQRAMSLTDVAGGFLVPYELDSTILLTSDGSNNPLIKISRVIQTVSDVWHGVTSQGVVAEWLPESSEAADASPTLTQPAIPSYKASVFVPFSVELQGDATTLMQELARLLQDGADQLLAEAFTTGSGVGRPTGIISALADSSSVVTSDGSEALAASDIYKLQNALPPRFQARASWNANLAILNTIRQFETTNGALKFPELSMNPPMLLGRSVYENSNMDGTINAAATETNHVLVYGDFSQFAVTLRTGSSLELVQHLMGANQRPTDGGTWGPLVGPHQVGADIDVGIVGGPCYLLLRQRRLVRPREVVLAEMLMPVLAELGHVWASAHRDMQPPGGVTEAGAEVVQDRAGSTGPLGAGLLYVRRSSHLRDPLGSASQPAVDHGIIQRGGMDFSLGVFLRSLAPITQQPGDQAELHDNVPVLHRGQAAGTAATAVAGTEPRPHRAPSISATTESRSAASCCASTSVSCTSTSTLRCPFSVGR